MNTEDENKTYTDMIGHLRNEYEVRIWVARFEHDVTRGNIIEDQTTWADQAVHEFRKRIDSTRSFR